MHELFQGGQQALLYATLSFMLTVAEAPTSSAQASNPASAPAPNPSSPAHKTTTSTHTTTTNHHAVSKANSTSTTHKTLAHKTTSIQSKKSSKRKGKTSKGSAKRGQQIIDSARAREIQEALIREHYLQGEPSGEWDSATQQAMQKYQEDQGWQSKTTPDSRALIKLGLGPSHDHLLNPESAMTSADPKPDTKPNASAPATTNPAPSDPPQR